MIKKQWEREQKKTSAKNREIQGRRLVKEDKQLNHITQNRHQQQY